jgi:hypothetical protein
MIRRILVLALVALFSSIASLAGAAMTATGNVAPLIPGNNVLAAAAFNDSPGSSDMTVIVKLTADGDVLVDEGDACKAIQPLENIPSDANPTGWTELGFDDSGWQDGENGVGYGDGDDNTVLGDGNNAAVYMRIMFVVDSPGAISSLELGVDFDDGAVVWLNGVEIAREAGTDIAEPATFDSWTDQGSGHSHEASKADPPNYETVDVPFEVGSAVSSDGKLAVLWGGLKK